MMASIMVTGAAAAFTDANDIDSKHQEAVDMSVALSIIQGYPDGSFQPNGNVTRAEMAKIICIALNGGQEPATSVKPTPSFADIDGHWAEGFIEYCYAKGVVAGKDANTFDPSGNVTGSEAAKMLLVALGYNADVEKYVGSDWELYVNVQANQDGLYDKLLDIQTADPLSREHAAQMIWNAIQAYVIDKHSQIDRTTGDVTDIYTKNDWQDMLDKYYSGDIFKGQLTSWSYNDKDKDWDYSVESNGETIFVNSATDYTSLIGQQVKAVYEKGDGIKDAYGIFAVDSQVLFSGLVGDLPTLKPDDTSVTFDGTKYKLDSAVNLTTVYEFSEGLFTFGSLNDLAGKAYTVDADNVVTYSNTNIKDYDSLNFCAVDYDGNGKVDFFEVVPVIVAKVGSVNNSDITLKASSIWDPCLYLRDYKYSKDDVNYYEGLAKGDWVAITPALTTADETDVFTKLDMLNGKVTIFDDPKVTVDGNVYKLDVSYDEYADGNVKAGTTFKDAPLYNNYIFDGDVSGNHNVSDYVVVLKSAEGDYAETAQLLFSDGTKKIVDLNTKNTVSADLEQYGLYTYETNKDKEYSLYTASNDGTGFDLAMCKYDGDVVYVDPAGSGSKVRFINDYTVADDAVIFIKDSVDDCKVISGARLKSMAADQFADANQVYVLGTDDSAQGKGLVNMAYVVTGEDTIKADDSLYGYITGVVGAQNDDSQDIYKVTLYTKDGEVTLDTVATSDLNNYSKDALAVGSNQAIEYTVDEDGLIDEISFAVEGKLDSMDAITGKSSDALWVNDVRHELDDGIIYLVVDFDDESGVEVGTINSIDVADKDAEEIYIPNAIVMVTDDAAEDILCVFYDVNNGSTL